MNAPPANFEEMRRILRQLPGPDQTAQTKVVERQMQLTKPPGSLGRLEDAAATFEDLLKRDPKQVGLRGLIFELKLGVCDWSDYDATVADLSVRVARGERADNPFNFSWYNLSAAAEARCVEIFAAREWTSPRQLLPPSPSYWHERIRLAYFSPDFREHPISYLFAGLIERHDRSRFEVCGISFGPDDGGPTRARLERSFDRFHDVRAMGDRELAEFIRREEIDIVIDLAGFQTGNRAKVLALRPAPVTVNFQGFGTGADFLDYLISDRRCIPKEHEQFYREKVVCMPDSWVMTDDRELISEATPSRASQDLPENGFVFCSFNNGSKFRPEIFDVWMRLLKAVPESVLWLPEGDAARRRQHAREKRRALLERPLLFERVHIKGREPANVAVAAR